MRRKRDSYDRDTNVVATEDEEYIMYPEIRQAAEKRLVRLVFACCQQLIFKGLEFDLGMTVLHSHRDLVSILLPSTGACTREIE